MEVDSRHPPDPSEVLRHLTGMFVETLNSYFAWAVARQSYEEELDLPHEVLVYFGKVATNLIGENSCGQRVRGWGANRDNRHSYEKALHFNCQGQKLDQYNDLLEIGSDLAAKWFPKEMLRLMSEEREQGARTKDEIYFRIADRVGLSKSTVKKRCRAAEIGQDFGRVLDRSVADCAIAVDSRHPPGRPEILEHLTQMHLTTLNPYFAWAAARHCYEEGLALPFELLIYFGTVATTLIGEDTMGRRDPKWGANRDDRCSYEQALHFDRQVKKLEQYRDLKEIGSDRAAKWFPDEMLRLFEEEKEKEKEGQNGDPIKEEVYLRIAKRIGLSDSAVKKRYRAAQKGEDFRRVLDRRVVDWDDGVINISPPD